MVENRINESIQLRIEFFLSKFFDLRQNNKQRASARFAAEFITLQNEPRPQSYKNKNLHPEDNAQAALLKHSYRSLIV